MERCGVVLTNIPKLDGLGIWSPTQSLQNSLAGLDVARVIEGDVGARLVFKKRLDVEAQEGPGCIRLDVVAAIQENGIEFDRVGGGRD